jgi:hypothetical protein
MGQQKIKLIMKVSAIDYFDFDCLKSDIIKEIQTSADLYFFLYTKSIKCENVRHDCDLRPYQISHV